MCCQISVKPLDVHAAYAILATGLFVPRKYDANNNPLEGSTWWRSLGDPTEYVYVELRAANDQLRFFLRPTIGTYVAHQGKRLQAAVALEMAWRYAEKVNGMVTQHANVTGCTDDGRTQRLIGAYPDMPMDYSKLCAGFAELFLGGD